MSGAVLKVIKKQEFFAINKHIVGFKCNTFVNS